MSPNRYPSQYPLQSTTKTAEALRMAPDRLLRRHLDHMRKIITYDKGAEHVEHILVTMLLDSQSYLCNCITARKRAQWNMSSSLSRSFLPKKTYSVTIASEHLKQIEAFLKGRPRKGLDD